MGYYDLTDDIDSFKDCWITESYLLSNLSCRELEFKEFYDPEPVSVGDIEFINPSTGEVRKLVTTVSTSVPGTSDSANFPCFTSYTEVEVIFPTCFYEKSFCRFLRFYNNFK